MRAKKHYTWSRDAETNDMIHVGSDQRRVMARFVIPMKAKKRLLHSEVTSRETDDSKRSEVQEEKRTKHAAAHGFEKSYQDFEKEITEITMTKTDEKGMTKHGKAAAAAEIEVKEGREKEEEILAVISEGRSIKKEEKERIRGVSKEI